MSKRIFSQDEIKQLIKKAAELESERSVSGRENLENGLTIDELKNIASETGLDPELIEQAASDMEDVPVVQKEKVRVNRDEIASEVWLDQKPDKETMDMLIKDLNHMYGTTDELNWWEKLWRKHKGKAVVERTPNMTEWIYTSPSGAFTTRVLLQQRGKRFRIRVSKRLINNMVWDSAINTVFYLVIPIAFILVIFGLAVSDEILGTIWPGIVIGLLLSLLSYPLLRKIDKKHIKEQKVEAEKTIHTLSELILHSKSERKNRSFQNKKEQFILLKLRSRMRKIHPKPSAGRLRNNLED